MFAKYLGWPKYLIFALPCICVTIVLLSPKSSATIAEPDPEEWTGSFSGGIDLWYTSGEDFRKAGMNINNEENEPYLVTGIRMAYNLSYISNYTANVLVQSRYLGEDHDAYTEHKIERFRYGKEKIQNFYFTEDEYLITDTDYNIQLRPLQPDPLTLQHYDKYTDRSRFWDNETGDWDTVGISPSSPSIEGREWAMSALAEPVKPLMENQPWTDTFFPPDAVDAYYTNLTLGKTYVFFLEHYKDSEFQLYLYRDRDQLGIPGKISENTLLGKTSGPEIEKNLTWTPEYSGRFYILVKSVNGGGTYEIDYQENRDPIAEAGSDVYANLKLGEEVAVDFENTLSYDPDDDKNNNAKIDLTEENNLLYYWDFDAETDTDHDGNYRNDKDATGRKLTHTFNKGGKFTVTLTVEDTYGASSTDTLHLYLNYIPIVEMQVSYYDEDAAYAEHKLAFSAEGTYDPNDDLNGNGIIDGSEVDHLTYSWDFYDAIDKNMDGNRTNDTDASNNMWLMKYPKAGIYTITLNVWDNPEPADRAYNHSQIVLEVKDSFTYSILDINNDIDYIWDKTNKLEVEDDVLVRKKMGSGEMVYKIGGYDEINLVRISAEEIYGTWYLTLYTEGNIILQSNENTEVYYSYYIVRNPYQEKTITRENIADIEVDYIYNFTFHDNGLTVIDEKGKNVLVQVTRITGYNMLQICVPFKQLPLLYDEFKDLEEDEMDFYSVFAMALYKSNKTVGNETQVVFARDSIGTGTPDGSLAGKVESGFFTSTVQGDDDDIGGHFKENTRDWILLIITGLGLFLLGTIIGVLGYSRIKRNRIHEKENELNIFSYIAQHPGLQYTTIKKQLNISDNTLAHHLGGADK